MDNNFYNLDDENQQQKSQAGGVIAGNSGVASPTSQPAGSGFTNLQTYLTANKGQGAGIAGDITAEGQKGVDAARNAADTKANTWADETGKAVDASSRDAQNQIYGGNANYQYGGPSSAKDAVGYNQMDQNYQNVRDQATKFAGDYDTQKAALQNKYGYGSGFGALDTFLGRQDAKGQIQDWQKNVNTGSIQGAADKVNSTINQAKTNVDGARAIQTLSIPAPTTSIIPTVSAADFLPPKPAPKAPAPRMETLKDDAGKLIKATQAPATGFTPVKKYLNKKHIA